jgi:hypothetical protein
MPGRRSRQFIRFLVAAALSLALLTSILAPTPEDLPTVAFGQAGLYRLEVALLTFYGSLLLVTPAFSGLAWGRLPVEISTRGARFAEEADQSAERNKATIEKLERDVRDLAHELSEAKLELRRINGEVTEDDYS